MARILIFVTDTPDGDAGSVQRISGQARVSDSPNVVSWSADVNWNSTPTQINQAIEDAAVAAATDAGHSITAGTNDRITLAAAKAL